MANKLRAEPASKLVLKVGNAAAKKTEPEPAAIPQELPMGPSAAHFYFLEARRILRTLQAMIQFGDPDSKTAVEATFVLARIATVHSAIAAHGLRTALFSQNTVKKMDYFAVLRAGNPERLPWFSKALERLSKKTFYSYRSRGPHKKGANMSDIEMGQWLENRIHEFWPGVISRERRLPPISDDVRARLLAPKNRLNGRKWAEALLDVLPKELKNPNPFEIYDKGENQLFFERKVPERKRPCADRVRAGFVKFAGERFAPLLKAEAEQAEIAYQILMRERNQTKISVH